MTSTTPLSQIEHISRNIAPGTSDNTHLCPYCGGGSSEDKSFSITRKPDGTVLFHCHRAKCGKSGAVGSAFVASSGAPIPKPKPVLPPRQPLLDLDVTRLSGLYGLTEETLKEFGVASTFSVNWVAIPVRAPDRRLRGWEYRQIPRIDADGGKFYADGPKTRHYRLDESAPWGAWYPAEQGDDEITGIIVVEDVWSAMKVVQEVGDLFAAYSLMGSHMNLQHVTDLRDMDSSICLVLDRDAQAKSIKFQQKYEHFFRADGNYFGIGLSNTDLKYLSGSELLELLVEEDPPPGSGSSKIPAENAEEKAG